MKRLIIDDLRDLPLEGTTVRTVAEAFLALLENDWDEIWLDHDLGGTPYETDDSLTIMPVVRMLETKDWPVMPVIYIHTMNPVGRANIVLALRDRYEIKHVVLKGG